jgi:hypothetical protein
MQLWLQRHFTTKASFSSSLSSLIPVLYHVHTRLCDELLALPRRHTLHPLY